MTIEAMRQALEALKTASSSTHVEQERLLHEAAIKRLRNAIDESETMQTQEPDMRHPKVQAIIGARARLQIELRLIEQLLDDPDFETTASDMEFWGPLHDRLKVRLAQPDQEPVAWMCSDESLLSKGYSRFSRNCAGAWNIPVYTAPRQWQGLTADEIWQCNAAPKGREVEYHICMAHQNVLDFAEAIEAKLKEKNT